MVKKLQLQLGEGERDTPRCMQLYITAELNFISFLKFIK